MNKSFKSGEQINIAKRQFIDTDDKTYYIESGYVGLYVGSGKHRCLLILLKTGNIFPLYATSYNTIWKSELHYVAMNDVSLCMLPREKFLREKDTVDKKELQEKLAKSMQGNVWLMERIVNLLMYDVSKRFYMRLLLLTDYLGTKRGDTAVLDIPLTYSDLAESIGTTRETINRLVSTLQNDGIISIEKRIITINSLSELQALYEAKVNERS